MAARRPGHRIFYGWWVLLAASVVNFWGAGFMFYSFTAFFNPLVNEFGWSYSATALATSFRSLEGGFAAPVVGFLVDRFGPRKLVFIGSIWAGLAFIFLSRITSLWSFYAMYVLMSIGASLMFSLPGQTAVANWFSRKLGLAMGIAVSTVGLAGPLVLLTNWTIAQYGWRWAFAAIGIGMWLVGLPLSLVLRHRPEQYGYLPDGAVANKPAPPVSGRRQIEPLAEGGGRGVRQALRSGSFWHLAFIGTITGAVLQAVVVHIMPSLLSIRMPLAEAGSIAAAVILVSTAGRFGFGWLGDRIDKRYLISVALAMEAAGLLVLPFARELPMAIAFLVLFGPGFGGTISLRLSIQQDLFGRRAFGSIQGLVHGIGTVGTMASPVLAGWVYDATTSYQWAWIGMAVLLLAGIPSALMLQSRAAPAVSAQTGRPF